MQLLQVHCVFLEVYILVEKLGFWFCFFFFQEGDTKKALRGKMPRFHSEAKVFESRSQVPFLWERGRKMGHRGTCCSTALRSREEAGICTFEILT